MVPTLSQTLTDAESVPPASFDSSLSGPPRYERRMNGPVQDGSVTRPRVTIVSPTVNAFTFCF